MPADDGWTSVSTPVATSASASYSWSNRPQLSISDIVLLLWRAKWMIVLISLPVLALSVLVALTLPVNYAAASRIQVTVGAERLYEPVVGQAPMNSAPDQQSITDSEVELLYSPVIFDRVIEKIGLGNIYPKAQAAIDKAPAANQLLLYERAINSMQADFSAGATPGNPVIRTSYEHENPVIAAQVLNTIIGTYLEYRSDLFLSGDESVLASQRDQLSSDLSAADDAIERFLVGNRIGDFNTEKTSIAAIYSSVTDELFKVQAQKSEVDGRLAALITQLALTEPTIDLSIESNYDQQLIDLQIRRESLLATYMPGTPQVQAIDRQIENVQNLISGNGANRGVIRRGPNEVFQTLDQRRAELEAESAALRTRFEELRRQKTDVERRQLELTRLEPEYQDLVRDRAILEERLRSLTIREGEERLTREVTRSNFDNIQILEPARPPAKGKSLKKLVVAAGLIFGLFTGGVFALIWIFTRSTLPTAGSVERTTGLPVLACVRSV